MLIVVGDALQTGGSVLTGSPHTDIDGRAVARVGDKIICSRHGAGSIVSGDATLIIDGQPVARNGDKTSCGCALVAGKQPLVHVSQGGAIGGSAASKLGSFIQAPSSQPVASSLVSADTKPVEPEQCWLNDHSCEVFVNPNGRYFEARDVGGDVEYDLATSFRIDVPLKSGGDIVVTAKIKVVKHGRVSDSDVAVAEARLRKGINEVLNNRFTLQVVDEPCGKRDFPIRYEVEFVSSDEDYVMALHDIFPREEVVHNTINVSVNTDSSTHLHEFLHCLGLPDEYMDVGEDAVIIRYFRPGRTLGGDVVTTRDFRHPNDPEFTIMFDQNSTRLKPRHAWYVGIEVQSTLTEELGREVACDIICR